MSTLRKRVSTYFRQLSFHQENGDNHENSIIQKYLQGFSKSTETSKNPTVFYGKKPDELPNFQIAAYNTESEVLCSISGPGNGLAAVRKREQHLEIPDSDGLDFIDVDNPISSNSSVAKKISSSTTAPPSLKKIDNRKMIIRVAGKEYGVENEDFKNTTKIDREFHRKNVEEDSLDRNEGNCEKTIKIAKDEDEKKKKELEKPQISAKLARKNKEEEDLKTNHRRRRSQIVGNRTSSLSSSVSNFRWTVKCDNVAFGVSDTLYDRDGVTKKRYGSPIADCYGVVARKDSFLLAVADGVNWGEKAAIAARSAIHGSLRYLNETFFQDTTLFYEEGMAKSEKRVDKSETCTNLMRNTSEIFVSLLRSFKCAHDLILENEGMLTTLTVAVVLPLEGDKENVTKRGEEIASKSTKKEEKSQKPQKRKFVCCVCNVGDTLAYAFSPRDGLRELTRASHDVTEDRDVRDALGALGPVDGKNPELANLTLSVTVLESDDLLLLASDGLTDNFDPAICRYIARKKNLETSTVNPFENNAANLMDDPLKVHFMESNQFPENAAARNVENSRKTMGYSRSKTALDFRRKFIERNEQGLPYVTPLQRYDIQLRLLDDVIRRNDATPKTVCDALLRHTYEITEQKRRLVEEETTRRRPRRDALEKFATKPGKLDHVTVVACRVKEILG